jgi:hypothetical protein
LHLKQKYPPFQGFHATMPYKGGELNLNTALTLLLYKEEYADRREVVHIIVNY